MRKITLVIFCFLLVSCSGAGHDDLRLWMTDATKNIKPGIKPLPEIGAFEPVAYAVMDALSPFDSGRIEPEKDARSKPGATGPDFEARERRNNIMERYALESMSMVGYMNINHVPMAAIQVDQMVKQIKVGDYIGLDFGVVTEVSDHQIVIRETVEDADGEWLERLSTLQLQSREDKQ